MSVRLFIVAACFLLVTAYLSVVATGEPFVAREPLDSCPMDLGEWSGRAAEPIDEATLAVLGVDDYLNRVYATRSGRAAGLYVGYYGSQRQGDTMHSPQNCLPGAGWSPVQSGRLKIDVPLVNKNGEAGSRTIEINRYLIEKGLDRRLVLYWYQARGRVVASEYLGKIYLVLDAMRTNQTYGALVRVVVPVGESERTAETVASDFVRELYPLLERYLP